MNCKTRKENLWAGRFGDEYAAKDQGDKAQQRFQIREVAYT